MTKNQFIIAITLLIATLVSVMFIDKPLALAVNHSLHNYSSFFTATLNMLEAITAFNISKYILTLVLLSLGLIFILKKSTKRAGFIFLFIAAAHFSSRLIAGILKNLFNRPRPYQFIEDNSLGEFFTNGSSFPSGHVAHFFSLFIPLVILFPRKLWWLLIIPAIVLIQRVLVNDHYLGDTLASLLIVYLVSLMLHKLFIRMTSNLPRM